MTKILIPLTLLLALTGCNERQGLEPRDTSTYSSVSHIEKNSQSESPLKTPEESKTEIHTESESVILVDVPILMDDLPTLPDPVPPEKTDPTSVASTMPQIFTGGTTADGLDIGDIRISHGTSHTRVVFDSYTWNLNQKQAKIKASASGHYSFKYNPNQKRITAIVTGYRGFSALGNSKMRTFAPSSIVSKIYLEKYADDSGFKCQIDLRENVHINVFELKNPGRIVLDIFPV